MNKFETDEILHVNHNGLEYIQFKRLNEYNINHCITLRKGGVSQGEYESLNFRTAGNDKIENVFSNFEIISKEMKLKSVYKARQNHSDKLLILNNENKEEYEFKKLNQEECDGYITNTLGLATLVTTADCNPIIIFDAKNRVIANVHAGWKGVINKIYIKAIEQMENEFDSNVEDIIVCVGPSIRKCCFTSKDEEFKNKFTNKFDYYKEYLYKEADIYHIDLINILIHEFNKKGIKKNNIVVANICTKCNCDDFFSYRVATQKCQNDYATMATIVQLGENNVK